MVTRVTNLSVLHPFRRRVEELDVQSGARTVGQLIPPELRGDEALLCLRNGRPAKLDERVWATDFLTYASRPRAEVTLGAILVNLLVAAAVGFAMSKLFPPPRLGEKDRDDEESPTYSFQGISNNRVEGLPIPVIYGEMRVGGTIIQEYSSSASLFPVTTDLYTLICYGEGPIHSIGGVEVDTPEGTPLGSEGGGDLPLGIKVNDNLTENYEGIEASVRLGTSGQEVIPGFEESRIAHEVDQKLTTVESGQTDTNNYVIQRGNGAEFDSTNDAFWEEHGVAFDLNVEDVDEFMVRVEFRQGYYRINSNGDLIPAFFGAQVRYRQLDGGGVPIVAGGPNNDGWVRLPIIDNMPWSKRSPFEWEYRKHFLDKDDYANPILGKSITFDGIDDREGAAQTNYPYDTNEEVDEFSISFWVLFESLDNASIDTHLHVVGDYNNGGSPNEQGWSVGLVRKQYAGFGSTQTAWTWQIEWGADNGRRLARPPNTSTPSNIVQENTWYHVVATYKLKSNNFRWRLHVNNDEIIDFEFDETFRIRASDQDLVLAHNPNGTQPSRFEEIRVDDIHFYNDRISGAIISQLWAGGNGTNIIVRGDICVAHYTWDSLPGGIINDANPDVGGQWYGDMAAAASAPIVGVTDGRVSDFGTGTLRPGQYRVEVIRVNRESTNTNVVNEAHFGILTSIIDATLVYPFAALLGLKIPATDQLNTTAPKISALVKGRLCPIWDGADEVNPAITPTWTQNPAWIAYDLLTNKRYGFGQFYSFIDIVLPDLLAWANYCDESVYDGGRQMPLVNNGWDNVFFDNSTVDPDTGIVRGTLELRVAPSSGVLGTLPEAWRSGKRMYITGFPDDTHVSTNINNDINSDTGTPDLFPGYVIYEVTNSTAVPGGAFIIKCYWDRLDETDPWTSGTGMLAQIGDTWPDTPGRETFAGGQMRFAFNGVFDSGRSAWDALLEICTVGRAIPLSEGKRIRFKFNSPRSHVGVLGMGSIIRDSFEINYQGPKQRPNLIEALILDEDREYEQTPVDSRSDSLLPANAGSIRKESHTLFGVTNRHQAERFGRFLINLNETLLRGGTFSGGANCLEYEPGDVVRIGHDILPRGVSGRVWEDSAAATLPWDRFKIDRKLVIEAGPVYKVYVHNAVDRLSEGEIDTSITVPGTYNPGDEIRIAGPPYLEQRPLKDDVFIIVEAGSELEIEITRTKRNQDMSLDFDFIEYNDSVFQDESTTEQSVLEDYDDDDPLTGTGEASNGRTTSDTLPERVRELRVTDRFVRLGNNDYVLTISASWRAEDIDVPYLDRFDVYYRLRPSDESDQVIGVAAEVTASRTRLASAWRFGATSTAQDQLVDFPLPGARPGDEVEVAVCPVKRGNIKRSVEHCKRGVREIGGFGPKPSPVTSVRRGLRSERVVYGWSIESGEEDSRIEIRRSSDESPLKMGYILAPVVYDGTPGQTETEPIRDWAGSTALATTRLLCKHVSPLGHKSDMFRSIFNPAPRLDSFPVAHAYADQEWSRWHGGSMWSVGIPLTGQPLIVDLVEVGTTPDNYLEFTGASLTATWRGAFEGDVQVDEDVDNFRTPREYMVEGILVVEQIHPIIYSEFENGNLDEGWERWTYEGPTYLRKGEAECSVVVQVRFSVTGDSSDFSSWAAFRPGVYTFAAIQFRIRLTRPTTAFNVKLHKFETRITGLRRGIESRPPLTASLSRDFFA